MAEYEGEVIHGHLAGVPESDLPRYSGKYAFISTPSGRFDIYAGLIDSAGRVAFHTGNIYGNCDLVCNIAGADSSMTGYIELESPFVYPRIDAPDPLEMARVISDDLKKRSFSMQVERRFAADTLYPLFRLRNNALLSSDALFASLECRRYFEPTVSRMSIALSGSISPGRYLTLRSTIRFSCFS